MVPNYLSINQCHCFQISLIIKYFAFFLLLLLFYQTPDPPLYPWKFCFSNYGMRSGIKFLKRDPQYFDLQLKVGSIEPHQTTWDVVMEGSRYVAQFLGSLSNVTQQHLPNGSITVMPQTTTQQHLPNRTIIVCHRLPLPFPPQPSR